MEYLGEEERLNFRVLFKVDRFVDRDCVQEGEWRVVEGRSFRKLERATEYADKMTTKFVRLNKKFKQPGAMFFVHSFKVQQQVVVRYCDFRNPESLNLGEGEEARKFFVVESDGVILMDGFRKIERAQDFADRSPTESQVLQQVIVSVPEFRDVTTS